MSAVRLLVAVACLALAACQSSSQAIDPVDHPEYAKIRPEIDKLIKHVRNSSHGALYAALQELVAYDVFAVDRVQQLLEDPNPRLRSNALWVLAQISDPEYPDVMEEIDDLLTHALEDPDRLVRYEAASGLVIRNKWEHIPILFEGMEDDSAAVRFACHATLMDVTAQNFGFFVDGREDERAQALDRWRHWFRGWKSYRG